MTLSPVLIHPLLEIYCFPRSADQHYVNTEPTRGNVLAELRELGLIEAIHADAKDSQHKVTAKGAAYIKAMLATPMPVQTWVVAGRDDRSLFEQVFGRGINW